MKPDKDKRSRILLAAVQAFSKQGYHKTKIEQIAQKADVGKGTVYEYFASKEQLFFEMIKYSFAQYRYYIQEAVVKEKKVDGKLRAFITQHFQFAEEYSTLARVIFLENINQDGSLHRWFLEERQQHIAWLEQLLAQAKQQGEIVEISEKVLARAIFGAVASVGHMYIQEKSALNRRDVTEQLLSTFLSGITKNTIST
ncbi:TetR family transcriptional regulator [Heliobacillus mobilis]|uniref:TetR family transcriptional regulator n=1 Tax=Heliobacterium mobile TaxID=28064 RepID=A0A6I3SLG7_HELMO|nr:TetR/AcrR family transcriptional regulator [Heliobacterium mobile]MTV49595.1 TetR family transcriptional regulator [Heliobacterium mobile]